MMNIIMNKLIKQGTQKSFAGKYAWLALSLITFPLNGQFSYKSDTLKIQEVVIIRKQISSEQPGFKFYDIDSVRLADYPLLSLAELLKETTPLFIKYYGSGGTATSSFRGTSAGHTQLMWNGININDPMVGQTDFSLIPSGMMDNIMVSFGGASMDLGNGAIGGIINLENQPDWKKQTYIDGIAGAGSFGKFSGLIKASTGNEYFQSVTKAFINSSENNFPYLDEAPATGPMMKSRENNQLVQKGLMQEIYLRKSENILSARIWYQAASRDLPGSIQYGYAGEKQSDESFRTLVNYDLVKDRKDFFATAAFMLTNLNYTSQLYSIDSRNKVATYVMKGGMTAPLGDYSRLKIVLSDELNAIETNNYSKNIRRNNASLTVSAERKMGDRLGAVALLRETLDDNSVLIPDFSAGIEYRIVRGEEHYLKLNVSRNSKIPSLNDRYWNPGGNPELRNEYAYSYEIGYKVDQLLAPELILGSEVNYFNNYIRDLIQWHPDNSSFWKADNIGSVNSSGVESSANLKYKAGNLSLDLNAGYSFTRAREINSETGGNSGKQLIYIPKNQVNASVHLALKNLYSIWAVNFTGPVFTNPDNSEFLDSYTLNSFTGGAKLNFKGNVFDLRFRVENIFDISYQSIAFYPQPGRSFFLTLAYQFRSDND